MLLLDNAKLYSAKMTREKKLDLGWSIFPHLPYLPDPAVVKRRDVVLLLDNAKLYSAKMTREKKLDLGWSIFPHLPYLPDIAPSHFHLFCFEGKKTFSGENMESLMSSKLDEFLSEKLSSYLINNKRLFKIIANILLIEINSLLDYSRINFILLKRK